MINPRLLGSWRTARRFQLALLTILIWGCATQGSTPPSADIAQRPEDLVRAPVEFAPPEPERWVLPNGLTVYYRFDEEVPLISGALYVQGGSLQEPLDKTGVAEALGSLLRSGGTVNYPPQKLDERLSFLAATVESGMNEEYATVSFHGLSEDFEEVFSLFSEVVLKPRFDDSRLTLWKKNALGSITRRKDNPSTMAQMAFSQAVYGEASPYAKFMTRDTLAQISRKAVKSFYGKVFHPNRSILAVSGAVSKERLQSAIEKHLAGWQESKEPLDVAPEVQSLDQPGVYVLKRDFLQTKILIGHLGTPRIFEDMYSVALYNRLFGLGGFTSRLFNEVRSKGGYAYSIFGGLFPGPARGLFQVGLGTRNDAAISAIREVGRIIGEMRTEKVDKEDLSEAKDAVSLSFVFKFDGSSEIVNRAAVLDILQYPPDFDETYLSKIESVDALDVLKSAANWTHPSNLQVVLVGNLSPEFVAEQLQGWGPVYELEFDTAPRIVRRLEQVK